MLKDLSKRLLKRVNSNNFKKNAKASGAHGNRLLKNNNHSSNSDKELEKELSKSIFGLRVGLGHRLCIFLYEQLLLLAQVIGELVVVVEGGQAVGPATAAA